MVLSFHKQERGDSLIQWVVCGFVDTIELVSLVSLFASLKYCVVIASHSQNQSIASDSTDQGSIFCFGYAVTWHLVRATKLSVFIVEVTRVVLPDKGCVELAWSA